MHLGPSLRTLRYHEYPERSIARRHTPSSWRDDLCAEMKLIVFGIFVSLVCSVTAKNDVRGIQQPLSYLSGNAHELDLLLSLHRDLVEIESITGNGKQLLSRQQSNSSCIYPC